ncbi:polysaccharide pyruvyl transferase CsaB [Synechococcus sp. PCC 7502]|uniref:polysaccharide pyruvyl transferase CsaB n=1 Tax=Synechococcus sp. PCC 7502 TaxID=1173263 RepID=UPI00029FBABE|nr:polysaccharide pyruvyl transferase CsaB [Synechococcus sp. PCC 7502]AFY74990.1 polysaccharide pyruvyl transferase CsaB [Synechococcus sp. PCC 7502]
MRAVLCGYYGMGNGGDEALLSALLQMLPAQIQPVVLSANPKATENLHQVQASDRRSVISIIKTLKQSDIFIWGGGSLMQDATSFRNPIYYGGLMGLAQGMGLKTVAWAQGIGPLNRNLTRWITKKAFAKCDRVSVRDSGSAQLLANWQIKSVIAPDPVWALKSESLLGLWTKHAPRIAIMLRSHPQLTTNRITCLITAIKNLQKSTGAYILLIPFQPSHDRDIAKRIHWSLGENANLSAVITETNPRLLKGIFKGVEMAIAMRYHGLIMAASEGCKCSAISYDPKVSRLMSDLNISGWELENLPTDPQEISNQWLEQFANGDPLSNDQISSLVDRALIHQELLLSL